MVEMNHLKFCHKFVGYYSYIMFVIVADDGKRIPLQGVEDIQISREEVETIFLYIQSWTQRQCSCCFRDSRNFERFNWAIQIFIIVVIEILKHFPQQPDENERNDDEKGTEKDSSDGVGTGDAGENKASGSQSSDVKSKEIWKVEDKDKLIHFVSKVFLNSFPTYVAYKQHMQVKNDEITPQEIQALSQYCEINEPEASPYLFRNVALFCKVNPQLVFSIFVLWLSIVALRYYFF